VTALLFAGGLIVIAAASELFTNAVEWAGHLMRLGTGPTGSLLAAFGTALPETIVAIVALVSGGNDAQRIAIGAVLGSSFLLLTLGGAITGVAVLARGGRRELRVAPAQARRDLGVFLVAFALAIGSAAIPRPARIGIGVILLLIYAGHVTMTVRGGGKDDKEAPEPLHIVRWRQRPPAAAVAVQLVGAVALIIIGSQLFVAAVHQTAQSLGIDPLVLAVIVIPFVTELPETFNSVLWIRSGDDELAIGNVAGSAAFQACVLGFLGVTFTTWNLGTAGLLTAACAFATGVYLLALLHDGRAHGRLVLLAALPWLAYVVAEFATGGHLG
jgi:cation:H+ antiporter